MVDEAKRQTLSLFGTLGIGFLTSPRSTGTAVAEWAERALEISNLPIVVGAQGQLIRLDPTFRPENRTNSEVSTYVPKEIETEPYASAKDIGLSVGSDGWTTLTTATIEQNALTLQAVRTATGDALVTSNTLPVDTSSFDIGNVALASTIPFRDGSISATLRGESGEVSVLAKEGAIQTVDSANGDTQWIVGTAQEVAGGVLSQQGAHDKTNPNTPYQSFLDPYPF